MDNEKIQNISYHNIKFLNKILFYFFSLSNYFLFKNIVNIFFSNFKFFEKVKGLYEKIK